MNERDELDPSIQSISVQQDNAQLSFERLEVQDVARAQESPTLIPLSEQAMRLHRCIYMDKSGLGRSATLAAERLELVTSENWHLESL